jgi:hypothetical protein
MAENQNLMPTTIKEGTIKHLRWLASSGTSPTGAVVPALSISCSTISVLDLLLLLLLLPLYFLRSRVLNSFNDVLLLLDTTLDRASGKPKSVSETLNIHSDGEGRKGLLEGSFLLGPFQEVSTRLRDRYLVSTLNPGRQ